MSRKREYATEGVGEGVLGQRKRPDTPMQALMECAPGEEPESSQMEMLAIRDILLDAMESVLTEEELWLFNALWIEQRSLREVGRMTSIPKTSLSRIRDTVRQKLADHLSTHTTIQEYLNR